MKTKVVQDDLNPVPAEVIAESIRKIGDAVARMDCAGLNDKAIILLLSKSSGVNSTEVKNVLWALRNLEMQYLKKRPKN